MRCLISSLVVIFATFGCATASLAAHRDDKKTSFELPSCVCYFGYGSDGCELNSSCSAQGGRCGEACSPPNGQDYSNQQKSRPPWGDLRSVQSAFH